MGVEGGWWRGGEVTEGDQILKIKNRRTNMIAIDFVWEQIKGFQTNNGSDL